MKFVQVGLCYEAKIRQSNLEACRQYDVLNFEKEMLQRFQKVSRSEIKHVEGYLYEYAQLLIVLEADPVEIEAAVATWRRNFPNSKLPDPRLDANLTEKGR